jgi:hypothetical protein
MRLGFNDIRYIIQESYRRVLLTEISNNAIETMIKRYNSDIGEVMNMTLGEMEERQISYLYDIYDEDINSSPMMKMKDYVRLRVMREFNINRGNGPIKYIRGIIRICFDESNGIDFMSSLVDVNRLKKFKQLVGYIYSNGLDFDEDLNGMDFVQLNRAVGSRMRIEAYRKWLDNGKNEYGENGNRFGDYTVVKIDSHNDAAKYSEYTSWCVTQRQSWYDDYAGDGSQFYFCLKDGFENVKKTEGEGCPLDEYGLSMVSVCIRPNGEKKVITTRWNHSNKGEDNPKLNTLEQVESVLGIPKNIFMQHVSPELELDDLEDALGQGVDVSGKIKTMVTLGAYSVIKYGNFYNVMNNFKLLSKVWYNGYRPLRSYVELTRYDHDTGMMRMLIDEKGRVFPHDIPYAVVDTYEGKHDMFIVSDSNGNKNLIKRGGSELILPAFIYNISPVIEGYSVVETRDGRFNVLTEDLVPLWDDFIKMRVSYFHWTGNKEYKKWKDGMLIVMNAFGKETYLDLRTKEPITDEWFDDCWSFEGGLGKVRRNDNRNYTHNYIRRDGSFVCEEWFEDIEILTGRNYIKAKRANFEYVLLSKSDGKVVVDNGFHYISDFTGKYGCGKKSSEVDSKITVFDSKGDTLFEVEGMVGLVVSDLFLIITPTFKIYDSTGKLVSDNIAFLELEGFDGYGFVDHNTNRHYLYNPRKDILKIYNSSEEMSNDVYR